MADTDPVPDPVSTDDVHVEVWWAEAGATAGLPDPDRWLDAVERDRLTSLRQQADRERFLVGAALSRVVLGRWLAVAPSRVALRRTCSSCERLHGRPTLVTRSGLGPVHSVSHTGDHVVVAVTTGGRLGVDAEVVDPARPLEPDLVLHPSEHGTAVDPWSAWTRKEAAVKATGEGLRREPRGLVWTSVGPGRGTIEVGGITVHTLDLTAPDDVVAALATDRPARVRVHDGTAVLRRALSAREMPCPA